MKRHEIVNLFICSIIGNLIAYLILIPLMPFEFGRLLFGVCFSFTLLVLLKAIKKAATPAAPPDGGEG